MLEKCMRAGHYQFLYTLCTVSDRFSVSSSHIHFRLFSFSTISPRLRYSITPCLLWHFCRRLFTLFAHLWAKEHTRNYGLARYLRDSIYDITNALFSRPRKACCPYSYLHHVDTLSHWGLTSLVYYSLRAERNWEIECVVMPCRYVMSSLHFSILHTF